MLQPKKPLDLSSAKEILAEQRKPLDLSSAESILKKKDSTKSESTSTTKVEKSVLEPISGSLDFLKQPQSPTDIVLEGNRQIAQIPSKPEDQQKAIEEEKRSFLGETFAKLRAGSAQLGADLASAPELLYDVFSAPQNYIAKKFNIPSLATDAEKFKDNIGVQNAVKEYYKQDVANIRKESELVDKQYQQGIYDSFSSGNYEDGFRQLTNSFSESLPATTSIMVGGAYTKAPQLLSATTMVFGGGKNEQLKDESPEMDTNARVANALGTGLAQGAFETIGSGSIGSAAKALVQREGAKKGTAILKDGLVNFYKESLKKNPMLASVSGEAIEEWATTVTENSIDVATGRKPADFNVFEGSVDSFISGAFGGAVFGGGLKGIDKITTEQDKKAVKQNFKKTFELQRQLENPEVSEPVKLELQKAINQISKENQSIISKNIKSANSLPEKVREKLVESVGKMEEISKKVQDVKIDTNTSDASKKILLEGLKQEYEQALKTKNDIIEGKDNGWLTTETFNPEEMIRVNGNLFTFKNGEVYIHNQESDNGVPNYNKFYGEDFNSEASFNFSQEPSENKVYKAIEIEGSTAVQIALLTNLDEGYINQSDFDRKEGNYFAYVRGSNSVLDTSLLTSQGIGEAVIDGLDLNFTFANGAQIDPIISVGDLVLNANSQVVGTILSRTGNTLTMDAVNNLTSGDFVFALKPNSANQQGILGYYMKTTMTFSSDTIQEIFALSCEVAKSFMDYCKDAGVNASEKLSVHPSTLKALVKEQMAKGIEFPETFFSVASIRKSVIKTK